MPEDKNLKTYRLEVREHTRRVVEFEASSLKEAIQTVHDGEAPYGICVDEQTHVIELKG